MIWLTLLRRFWPHLLAAGAVIAAGAYLHHSGYESGYAAREAYWKPLFDAAVDAKAKADARADALEAASNALSAQSEKSYAEKMASLTSRAADSDVRIRGLMRELAARSRCREVSSVPAAPAIPDAASASDAGADRAGESIAGVGKRCEADAAALAELQNWVRGQASLLR